MKKGIIAVAIIIILGIVVYALAKNEAYAPEDDIIDDDTSTFAPAEVSGAHYFSDGVHVIAGSIDLPSPCYNLETDVRVAESFPEQVTVAFTSDVDEDLMCAQVITPTDYYVEVEASEEARFNAEFNGERVDLLLSDVETRPESPTLE